MIRYAVLILVFFATHVNAQCDEKYDSYYDSLSGHTVYLMWPDTVRMKYIRQICFKIDHLYDTVLNLTSIENFSSTETKFCESENTRGLFEDYKICNGMSNHNIQITMNEGEISRTLTNSINAKGRFKTVLYFWAGKAIYLFQSFEYFQGEAPKDHWINKNGIPGWEAEMFLCDNALVWQQVKGAKENKKRSRKFLNNDPLRDRLSNSYSIIQNLWTYQNWMKWEYFKSIKSINISPNKK